MNPTASPEKLHHTVLYEEVGFAQLTQMKEEYATNFSPPHSYIYL